PVIRREAVRAVPRLHSHRQGLRERGLQELDLGSPAYAPRITQPLALPAGSADVAAARTRSFAPDLPPDASAHQAGEMADFTPVTPSDELGSAPSGSSSSTPTDSTIPPDLINPATPSALDDLWDSGWPSGQYYWTVVPVQAGVDSR